MSAHGSGHRLAPEVQILIAHIASRLDAEAARTIQAQASTATSVVDSPTMLDLRVDVAAHPIPVPDGPLPVRAIVYHEGKPVGEILVWVKSGALIGVEQTWFTDERPKKWPPTTEVQLS